MVKDGWESSLAPQFTPEASEVSAGLRTHGCLPRALSWVTGRHKDLGSGGLFLQSPAEHLHPVPLPPPEDLQVEASNPYTPLFLPLAPGGNMPLSYPMVRLCEHVFPTWFPPQVPSPAAPAPYKVFRGSAYGPRGQPAQSRAPESRYWLHVLRWDQREYWDHSLGTQGCKPGGLVLTKSCACRSSLGRRLKRLQRP